MHLRRSGTYTVAIIDITSITLFDNDHYMYVDSDHLKSYRHFQNVNVCECACTTLSTPHTDTT